MKLILLLLVFFARPVFCVKEYYSLSRSVRARGMGGAFYAVSDDEYALFYNPAGLSLYRGGIQTNLAVKTAFSPTVISGNGALATALASGASASSILTALDSLRGNPMHLGIGALPYYFEKHFGIGLLVADTKLNFALLGRELETAIDLTAISDSGLLVTYARPVGDPNLHIGLTLKALARVGGQKSLTVMDFTSPGFDIGSALNPARMGGVGFGVDIDVGAIYDFPEPAYGYVFRAAVVLSNVLASPFDIAKTEVNPGTLPTLPRLFTLALYSIFPGYEFIDNFHLALDVAEFQIGGEPNKNLGARSGVIGKHINFGVEMPIYGFFIPRFGFHQGYWTAGFGLNLRILRLDFATYGEELALGAGRLPDRRYEVRLQMGWSPAPAAPVVTKTPPRPSEQSSKKNARPASGESEANQGEPDRRQNSTDFDAQEHDNADETGKN